MANGEEVKLNGNQTQWLMTLAGSAISGLAVSLIVFALSNSSAKFNTLEERLNAKFKAIEDSQKTDSKTLTQLEVKMNTIESIVKGNTSDLLQMVNYQGKLETRFGTLEMRQEIIKGDHERLRAQQETQGQRILNYQQRLDSVNQRLDQLGVKPVKEPQ